MKTKYSTDDPITSFCEATSEPRESAFFFLECFNWDLDKAVSGFLKDQLSPIHKQLKPSPSLLKQSYSVTPVLKSKWSSYTDFETSLDDSKEHTTLVTKDSSHDSNDIPHDEKFVSMPNPVNHGGSCQATNESTSIEIGFGLRFSDHGWDSD
ncbi:unnamed protein product [Arabis nemorensis]|uniref:Uncharacterized protein n=1 Tax=Arabis nemorensis TaxID=586526 RepID=A0A565AN33_9BRAS|nr:unnamed protein product [Arabis nemorensis]